MKKTLLSLFALFITTMAFAYDAEIDGIYYNFNSGNKTAEVTDRWFYAGSYSGDIIIPEKVSYNGVEYSVTSIGEEAFLDCTGLTSVEIPNSITSIGDAAFSLCSSLTSVYISDVATWCNINFEQSNSNPLCYAKNLYLNGEKVTNLVIPQNVKAINNYTFRECESLTSVKIPNSVTEIGNSAFFGCTGLTSIEIPNSVTVIGSSAFSGCIGLTSVEIPNSVTEIRSSAFNGCTGLTSIEIPESLTSIGHNAFNYCGNLTTVVWNAIGDYILVGTTNSYSIFSPSVTSFIFGDKVERIPANLCNGLNKLTSITIPNSVWWIDSYAFTDCIGLTAVNISDIAAWCNISFDGWDSNPLYYAKNLYLNGEKVTDLIIPESVKIIRNSTFYNCESLRSIEIPDSVIFIGEEAFRGCTGLTSIEIPNSVTEIGNSAFFGCTGLTLIEIPNSVTEIGSSAFSGCTSLISVIWNATRCKDFSSNIKIPFGTQIVSFTFGDAVEYIPAYLCYGMDKLTSISIPNSVTSIGNNVFEGCSSLSSVNWNIKKYNDFSSKENLFASNPITSFTFGDDVEYIPAYICYNMTNLNSIVIPNLVTEIGASAFEGCGKLRTVEIGKGITSIGNKAFAGCSAIYSMGIDAIIPPIVESSTFNNVSRTTQIKVPCSAVAAYQASSYWNEFTNYVETPYTLVVNTNDNTMGNAIVIKQPTCQDISAQVQAQALPGYEFVKWSDGFTENPHTVFVTSDTIITAEFRVASSTPVENTYDSNVKIYANGGNLHIEGIIEDYQVFDAFGRLVYSGRESVLSLPRGVYMVVVDGEVQKIVL